ncbi:MAG: VCBS repeat-containing protein [Verrucomicrobiales bacterium]|nr:VCBS repeat-containing protein [Verrucomicrobiales bacterium]
MGTTNGFSASHAGGYARAGRVRPLSLWMVAIGVLWIVLDGHETATASTVQGRVVDVNGVGVSGVTIEIVQVGGELPPWNVVTGEDGRYQMDDALIFGNLDITASKRGFVFLPRVKSVFDPGNSVVTADFGGFTESPVESLDPQFDRLGIVLNGTVNPIGLATGAFFEYGSANGLVQRTETILLGGGADQPISVRLSSFVSNGQGDRFFARLVATNLLGRSQSSIREVSLPTFLPRFTARATDALVGPNVLVGDANGAGSMDFFLFDQDSSDGRPLWRSSDLFSWNAQLFCLGCGVSSFIDGQVMGAAWTDVNYDNRPDMLVAASPTGRVLQNTDGGLVPTGRFEVGFQNGSTMRVLDLNADGLQDWVMSGTEIITSIQAADGSFKTDTLARLPGEVSHLVAGDVDADGWPDLVAALNFSTESPALVLLRGSKTNGFNFDPVSGALLPANEEFDAEMGLALADLDGDGALDIVSATRDRDGAVVFQILWNDGTGQFNDRHFRKVQNDRIFGFTRPEVVTGDFDNDGLEEVLLSGNPAYRVSARGRQVKVEVERELSPDVGQMERMDADADGRLDLLLVSSRSGQSAEATVMRNHEVATNQPPKAPTGLRMERSADHLVLRWEVGQGDDHTPPGTLTWNVRVGTTAGGTEVLSPLSDLPTGRRKILESGNAGINRFLNLKLGAGVRRFYWAVQAVDAGYLGGEWSAEREEILDQNFRLIEVVLEADGSVRVVGAGAGGLGAVLNVSEDLVTWTPLLPFVRVGDRFEARDTRARAAGGRFYQAR